MTIGAWFRQPVNPVTHSVFPHLRPEGFPPCPQVRLSLTDVWTADEAFTTGTMGGLAPVVEVDGRRMTTAPAVGPVTQRLRAAYAALQEREGVLLPF